jgi:lipopolysaccharide export system protein LptA
MRRLRNHLLPGLIVLVISSSLQAQPQPSGPPNALQGFSQNRDQPVKIDAASLEVRDRSKVATFSGNVHLVQGDTTLRCKTLVVYYDGDTVNGPTAKNGPGVQSATPGPSGSQQIRRMEAKGDVLVTQKDQTATGDSAIYDMKTNTVTLIAPAGGSVAVTQGGNVMKGSRLVVDLTTNVSHFEGRVSGLIIPSSAKGGDNKGADPHGERAETRAEPNVREPPRDTQRSRATNPAGLY